MVKIEYKIGDYLELTRELPANSIDLILTDPPYGVTRNKADNPIPLNEFWPEVRRVTKENSAIIITSQFPYTLDLIMSNRNDFRYDLIWDKGLVTGFLNAKKMPLRIHEHILVFYRKLPTYNPIYSKGEPEHGKGNSANRRQNRNYGKFIKEDDHTGRIDKLPRSIFCFQKPHPSIAVHPTQKPLELFVYIIKLYSNKGDMILDPFLGSGTTLEACRETGRNGIGFEINPEYESIIKESIKKK